MQRNGRENRKNWAVYRKPAYVQLCIFSSIYGDLLAVIG